MKSSVIILTCLGFAFIGLAIKIYEPDSSASVWILIIGISLLISAAILRKRAINRQANKIAESRIQSIYNKPDLKTSGKKIIVKISDCVLKDRGYYEEKLISHHYETQAFTALNNPMDNIRTEKHDQVYLCYTTIYEGKERHFVSNALPYSKVEFKMLMDVDKELTIYVDRNNPGLYLFDLEI